MSAHTPGPWTADDGDSDMWGIFADATGEGLAYLCEPSKIYGSGYKPLPEAQDGEYLKEVAAANARLIAAAPELLEAAQAQEQAETNNSNCPECEGEGEGDWAKCGPCSERFGRAIDLRCAAIAKATQP